MPRKQSAHGQPAVYNSGLITLADGESAALQVDINGRLIISNLASDGTASPGGGTTVSGEYNATPPNLSDGQANTLQIDPNGNLKVTQATLLAGEDLSNNTQAVTEKSVNSSTYAPSFYQMPGTPVTVANIKTSAGSIQSFMASNANAAVRYFQVHNTSSAPSGGAVPYRSFPLSAGTATNPGILLIDRHYLSSLIYCPTGISFAFSTTYLTYTAATAADHFVDVNYL